MNDNEHGSTSAFAAHRLRDRFAADGLAYLLALMPVALLLH
ncbi:hypothetical protein [Ensifer adhaerens]|nr:hypothetical protein [Ensifer adhaerens]